MAKKNNDDLTIKSPIGEKLNFASAEAYNLLRTCLNFSFVDADNDKGKAIAITSASPREGKSYTSINIAYSLATAGKHVLLIDCDMRRPSISDTLELDLAPGLSNILVSNFNKVIHKGVLHENADVITAGDIPPNPSELLASERMKQFIDLFRENYDYIIIDLPPVLSVADPLTLSKIVDGYVFVLMHNSTRRSELNEAIRQVKMMDAHILGFVYNGYKRNGAYYSRKYRSYYKKNYYPSVKKDETK